MTLSTKDNNRCQNCGKFTTEKLSRVMGDAIVLYVCKDCRASIKRLSHIVWITVAGCVIAVILFGFYFIHFPEQIENIFRFFEKSFANK